MAVSVATVDAAITSIMDNGQSVTIDGIVYSQGNLGSLITLRDQLKLSTLRTGGTRPMIRAVNFGSMGYGQDATGDSTPTPVYT